MNSNDPRVRELVLYCFECSHIGLIEPPALACCPDSRGMLVYRGIAVQAWEGFHAALVHDQRDLPL